MNSPCAVSVSKNNNISCAILSVTLDHRVGRLLDFWTHSLRADCSFNYFSPYSSNAEYLTKTDLLLQNAVAYYNEVIAVGDFNLDIFKSNYSKKVKSLADNSNLTQLITEATRITPESRSCLDLAFVAHSDMIIAHGVHHLGLTHSLPLNCIRGGFHGTQHLVFRLSHFNAAIFRADNFCNCLNSSCASFGEKKMEVRRVVFSVISIN